MFKLIHRNSRGRHYLWGFHYILLQNAIMHTRDMGESMHKHNTFTKHSIPQRDKDQKSPQRDWKGKPKMDDDTMMDLMRKKLCFSYRDSWVPCHRCMGKGQVHYIEVDSDNEEEEEEIISVVGSDS
jgi:hypothetical protein